MTSIHSQRLDNWLGHGVADQISRSMKGWYGKPIPILGVPGRVFVGKDGDFFGSWKGGFYGTLLQYIQDRLRSILRRWSQKQRSQCNTGFSSLSDLISEATVGGKRRQFAYNKVGVTGVVAASQSLWGVGPQPAAGAAGSAAPGGRACDDATTGGFPFTNPGSPDTQHLTRWDSAASVIANVLLLYDRLFDVAKTMSSSATESVTGVPTRYQSTTPSAADYAGSNFLFVECFAALGATAHNWTTCLYTDQDGNAGATLPSLTGISSCIQHRLDHPTSQWFAPLATGDSGIKALTQMQCSAVVTGSINFVIGKPLAFIPHPVANTIWILDCINAAFNLARIFDDACLALMEVTKPATGATTYTGIIETCAG